MAQTEAEIQRQKEMQQAEELLFSGRQELSPRGFSMEISWPIG